MIVEYNYTISHKSFSPAYLMEVYKILLQLYFQDVLHIFEIENVWAAVCFKEGIIIMTKPCAYFSSINT